MSGRFAGRIFAGDARTLTLWVIAITALWRLVSAGTLGYGTGEAYYVATARHLHLSYFDQPPLSLWIAWASMALTGSDAPIVLRLPFVLLFSLSSWLIYRIGESLHSPAAGFLSVLIVNASILFTVSIGTWIQPDAPMITLWLATTLALVHVLFGKGASTPWKSWGLAGLFLGLALLAKYHAVFLAAGAGLFVLSSASHRHWLRHPAPWAAIVLALAVFSPVLFWNAQNGWVSFGFQGGRALGEAGLRWDGLALMVAGQWLYMTPWLAIPALFIAAAGLRAGPSGRFPVSLVPGAAAFLAYCAWPAILLFTLVALWSDTEFHFHWQAPGYLMGFILMGCWSAERLVERPGTVRAFLYGSFALTFLILSALLAHAATGFGRHWVPGDWEDPTALQLPWTEVGAVLEAQGAYEATETFVAGFGWIDCGYIDTQVSGRAPLVCLGGDRRNLDFVLDATGRAGWDAYLVVTEPDMASALALAQDRFASVSAIEEVFVHRFGRAELGPFQIVYGQGFVPVAD